jgi:hypothetical protein
VCYGLGVGVGLAICCGEVGAVRVIAFAAPVLVCVTSPTNAAANVSAAATKIVLRFFFTGNLMGA